MLTKDEFIQLKAGDVVLYNGRPRIIWQGPADHERRYLAVTFAIKHRSWTGRIYTVQGYHDIKHKLSLPPEGAFRSLRELRSIEKEMLEAQRFNVAAQIQEQINEEARRSKFGWYNAPKPRVLRLLGNALKSAKKTGDSA